MNIENQYDTIAKEYDSLFTDEQSIKENKEIASMLSSVKGSVLDIGCGTGLLLDLMDISKRNYWGVDSSKEMLKAFAKNHPEHTTANSTFEDFCKLFNNPYLVLPEYFISLFGSVSYISIMPLLGLPLLGKVFLMFYREDYKPRTYELTGCNFNHYVHPMERLQALFPSCEIKEFSNYYIVTNL